MCKEISSSSSSVTSDERSNVEDALASVYVNWFCFFNLFFI